MATGLRSMLGPTSGGIITTEGTGGSIILYQIGVLEKVEIRLRNPDTKQVVPLRQALGGTHSPSLYDAWNGSFMPELTGTLVSLQFSHMPAIAPQMAHLVELGFYLGMRFEKLMQNKGLVLDVTKEKISAAEMDKVLAEQRGEDVSED